MKNRIEAKIELLVDYIISKPLDEITIDDYSILLSELYEIHYRERVISKEKQMTELISKIANSPYAPMDIKQ